MNTLEIKGISKSYSKGTKALDNVSLHLQNGIFGLLGPNGAGKSTLMRTIATLQTPDHGTISFNGQNIEEHPNYMRSRLGYLPQAFGVYPGVSCESMLDYLAILKGIKNKAARREQIHWLLQKTNLYPVRKKAVSKFSGGMKQRFGIAQALLGSPKLLIVDEPTAGLDPEERNRFHNLLSELSENMIILLSTHIVEDVRELCADMSILLNGQIATQGTPNQLVQSLQGLVWQQTVTTPENIDISSNAIVLSQRIKSGKVQRRLLADFCPGPGYEETEPTLEDFYFSILQKRPSHSHVEAHV